MSADDIQVISGPEAVRRRPAMYLGALDDPGLPNFLLREALCCARDAAIAGTCHAVRISLGPNGRAVVRDDSPGLPLAVGRSGLREAERYLTVLGACSAGRSSAAVAASTCTVGLAVLNAVCTRLNLRIFSDGAEWTQRYERGVPLSELAPTGKSIETGTELEFELDGTILTTRDFQVQALAAWIRGNVSKLNFTISDTRDGTAMKIST